MTPDQLRAKASEWNDHQVLAFQAEQDGNREKALKHLAVGEAIERELHALDINIRSLVCPYTPRKTTTGS
jgi:hypothetical protein